MKILFVCLMCFVAWTNSAFGFQNGEETKLRQVKNMEQKKAEEIWEMAVQAKGGCQNIQSVKNLLISEKDSVFLIVLPGKAWGWDRSPKPLGLWVSTYNLEKNLEYTVNEYSKKVDTTITGRGLFFIRRQQLFYLLETEWVKPVPILTKKDRFENKKVDVVQTRVPGERDRVDFYFDEKTHLLVKVAFVDGVKGEAYSWEAFYDYLTVDGIQVPSRSRSQGSRKTRMNIEFNVEYDESIFERPPSIEEGPNAWQKKP